MAREKSTIATMRITSAVLFAAVAGLTYAGIQEMRHWNILTGWKLIGGAVIPLALLLGFTLPVMCKVIRTNGKACGHRAYGLLFGCPYVAGHWSKKFRARLQFPHKEVKPITGPQPSGTLAFNYNPTRQRQEVKVIVEDGRLGVWGFWFTAVSTIAGIAGVIVAIMALSRS
jgi:hypothetical protein